MLPGPLPRDLLRIERLFEVGSELVNEFCRDSVVPSELQNEAVLRTVAWLLSDAHRQGIRSQKVDDLTVEYQPGQRSALKHSGAESLLSPFKQRRCY